MLKPKVKRLGDELIQACANQGTIIAITEGYRSNARQNQLYSQPWDGKDNDGDGKIDESDEKVTNAKAGQSLHNYGVAFDIIFVVNGRRTYSGDWEKVGAIGESLGLEWGGRWVNNPKTGVIRDRPHFQYLGGYTLSDFINNRIDESRFA